MDLKAKAWYSLSLYYKCIH